MRKDNLDKLGCYLRQSERDVEYLTFDEIEKIIGDDLSDKERNPHWWYTDWKKKQAQVWLSSGFETTDIKFISIRKGVTFKKIKQNKRDKILFMQKLKTLFSRLIIPILVTLIASFIGLYISKGKELADSLQKIEMYYAMNDADKVEELIYEVIPELKRRKDNETLCGLYNLLFEFRYNKYTNDNILLDEDEIKIIKQPCLDGLDLADQNNYIYYSIIFNNHLGKLFKYQYDKSFDIKDANIALEYYKNADETYAIIGDNIIPVWKDFKTQEDIDIAFAGLEANIEIYDLYYLMVQNGEFSLNDFVLQDVNNMYDNIFVRIIQYMGRVMMIHMDINRQISNSEFIYDYDSEMLFRGISVYSRSICLFYLLSSKYDTDIMKLSDNYTFEKVKNELIGIEEFALSQQQYDKLAYIYFDLSRVNYIEYITQGDLGSLSDFVVYLNNWVDLIGAQNITLREIDKYFFDITEGELLDYYIIELENALKNTSFSSNPLFFAYTKFELGKHYYYKAIELLGQQESDNCIMETLSRALDCCYFARKYYTDNPNSQIYIEIELLISQIECTYNDLSTQ